MILSTGKSVFEVAEIRLIGKKYLGGVSEFKGVFVRDIFDKERVYTISVKEAIELFRSAEAGKPLKIHIGDDSDVKVLTPQEAGMYTTGVERLSLTELEDYNAERIAKRIAER